MSWAWIFNVNQIRIQLMMIFLYIGMRLVCDSIKSWNEKLNEMICYIMVNTKDNGNIICQSISPTRFVSLFPVQVTSCLWIDRKWFEKWYMNILPRNFKINWCRLGKSKAQREESWINSLYCTVDDILFCFRHTLPTLLPCHFKEANLC